MLYLWKESFVVMNVKAIIFDYDGTLSNRFESAYRMYRYIVEKVTDLDPSDIRFEEIVQQCLYWDQYGHVNKSYVLNNLKEKYIPDLDVDYWSRYWYENFCQFQLPMPGSYEVLEKLRKKYILGILSNGDSDFQRRKIHALHFDDYVDQVIVCGDYGIQKPDSEIFRIAADRLGCKTEETAFIGDTFYKDISGAVRAGMKPVWMCAERKDLTYYPGIPVVHDFEDIAKMFLNDSEVK